MLYIWASRLIDQYYEAYTFKSYINTHFFPIIYEPVC